MDNHEAVRIGDLEKNSMAIKVVGPKFNTEDIPEAAVREGVDELPLRRVEEGMLRTFIDTTNVGDRRWKPFTAASREKSGKSCAVRSWR